MNFLIHRNILSELDETINSGEKSLYAISKFNMLNNFWKKHEEKEERFLEWFEENGKKFPVRKTLIREHRELRGHWKVLEESMSSLNEEKLKIALKIDGCMLIEKLRNHIKREDEFFEEIKGEGIKFDEWD